MELAISGKKALICGGSSGLGFAVAQALAEAECEIVIASRSADNLASALEKLTDQFPNAKATSVQIDMTSEASIKKTAAKLQSGGIDILVNNTGGPAAGLASEQKLEKWDSGYQELMRSVILLTEAFLPQMKEKKWGRILNITSVSAVEYMPKLSISGVFRAGLSSWVKSMAKEVSSSGVLLNNILPGPTNTPRLQELEKTNPEFYNAFKKEMAIGRVPLAHEVAKVAAFLCSGANTVVTGTDVVADGGYTRALI